MGRKNSNPGCKDCTCNRCGATAHAIPTTQHRRCSGNPDQPNPRARGENLPGESRGRWE